MTILVQKFGGTSLQSPASISKVITHIKEAVEKKYKLVVVVSALGRLPDPYATDTLLSLVNESTSFHSKREMDLLMSCGETIASVVLSNELQDHKVKSIALTGAQAGIMTTSEFTQAKIRGVNTARLKSELETYDVVVVAGFQGKTSTGEITTIGRGGSDTTAAALGVALQAEKVEIFTDVNGIMTADPRIVKSARQLKIVTYAEICNLAYQGAKVVHPRAIELVMQANIPLHVRSTYSTENGTLVTNAAIKEIPDQLITGIAHMSSITQIRIKNREEMHRLHSEVFKVLAETGISVDFINISPTGLLFTVPEFHTQSAVDCITNLGFHPQVIENCAKVSVVGGGMMGVPGIASKIVQALTEREIQILQSADSHTTIWVLIRDTDVMKAVNTLHETFNLSQSLKPAGK
ncbi:aspartate kinase [Virgibacillus phasianinus]|uniref:Aspartokinase n=1 Tax=Virgibacillus phasianinus TaxID=2017483 RepID=A0A220U593_9BACI|nr:aspartate kinase [Virgibacillus phasianinus]ASK63474.1 aspartate kinase [Virgibacillus phasianinus]